jgi:hypothetical protein
MIMDCVFRAMIVAFGVVVLAADGQTARADLMQQDSSTFSWKYEMIADPVGQDLDTNVGPDFSTVLGSPTVSGGIATMSGLATYVSNGDSLPGAVWNNISCANGYTIEVSLKSAQAAGMSASVGPDPDDDSAMTDMCAVSDSIEWLANGWAIDSPTVDGMFGANRPCTMADVRDGTSNTLMVGEVTGKGHGTRRGPFWPAWNIGDTRDGINGAFTVPGGIYPSATFGFLQTGFASYHPGGCNFVLADARTHFLSQNIADAVLKALTTRDGMNRRSYTTPTTEILISGPP